MLGYLDVRKDTALALMKVSRGEISIWPRRVPR